MAPSLPLSARRHNPPPAISTPPNPSAPPTPTPPLEHPAKKRKHHSPSTLHTATLRPKTWSYLHLRLTTASPLREDEPPTNLDPLTIRALLTPPLHQYLGATGAAIALDILHVAGRDVMIRVGRRDERGVRAGVAGWVGWCEGGLVPGEGDGKVRVGWRVVRARRGAGFGVGVGDGGDMFMG